MDQTDPWQVLPGQVFTSKFDPCQVVPGQVFTPPSDCELISVVYVVLCQRDREQHTLLKSTHRLP